MSRAALAWIAIAVPLAIVLVACALLEPISYDGWNSYFWQKEHALTLGDLYDYVRASYLYNNPRVGQLVTLLLYCDGPWHAFASAACELALFYLLAALALGRWPSPRRADDALVIALLVAITCACLRVLGPMLFYRPYVGNYTIPFAATIAFALPYRFALGCDRAARGAWWKTPAMLAAGFIVGACNEHVAPTVAAFAIVATVVVARRARTPRLWMIAGALGAVVGGIALLVAPGQDLRYDGIATEHSLLARPFTHPAADYARALVGPYAWLLLAAPWVALAIVRVRSAPKPPRAVAALAAASFAIELTLLLSPKLGARLYFAAQLLAIAALVAWMVPRLDERRRRIAAAIAGVVLAFAGWRCVHAYRTIAPEFAARLDALEHAPRGATVELPAYSFAPPTNTEAKALDPATVARWFVDSQWFVGDDLPFAKLRARVERGFEIRIVVHGQRATGDEP
jgi:hypothetical protein